jgi:hypothetical protein
VVANQESIMREQTKASLPGGLLLLVFLGLMLLAAPSLVSSGVNALEVPNVGIIAAGVACGVVGFVGLFGLYIVNPNEARVLQLFGRYVGTVREDGLRWNNPLFTKERISLRVRSFESAKIKVNDIEGNPIEIGAIVVWRVTDTAQASFAVDAYSSFVHVQAEAAVRNLATRHPYDAHDEHTISLRGHTDAIAEQLKHEIHARCSTAGVEIVEARIAHLAYAPEIAQAMLQRQQAGAIIAARQRIVDGAVGMVEMALTRLAERNVVDLDADRKAAMVSNLLVVLCGERSTQPIVNTGS